MSKIIASAAITGGYKILDRVEKKLKGALEKYGPDQEVAFPNTGYYLPIIYGITGIPVKTLGDMSKVLELGKSIMPPPVKKEHHLPYLGPALDAGMVTFFGEEIEEAIDHYLVNPDFYQQLGQLGLLRFQKGPPPEPNRRDDPAQPGSAHSDR